MVTVQTANTVLMFVSNVLLPIMCHNNTSIIHFEMQSDNGKHFSHKKRGYERHLYGT